MKQIMPSLKFSISGLLTALVICTVSALFLGLAVYFISRIIYLLFVFPVVIGFTGAYIVSFSIIKGKCRNYLIGILLAFIFSACVFLSTNYYNYLQFRYDKKKELQINMKTGEKNEINRAVDDYLFSRANARGFGGFMKLTAVEGLIIGKIGNKIINARKAGTYIYWIFSFAVIFVISIMGIKTANEPFCDHCDRWYHEEPVMKTGPGLVENVQAAIEQKDITALTGYAQKDIAVPYAEIKVKHCPVCKMNDVLIKLDEIGQNKRGRKMSRTIFSIVMPYHFYENLKNKLL